MKSIKRSKSLSTRKNYKYKVILLKIWEILKIILLIVLIGSICLVAYYYVQKNEVFEIKEISISGTQTFVNKKDLNAVVQNRVSNSDFFKLNPSSLSNDLENNFQGAKSISAHKKFPNKLEIIVVERVPLAVLRSKNEFYLVDDEGYVLGIVDPKNTNLPIINYSGEVKVGFFIDKELVPLYLGLIESLDENNLNVSSISIGAKDASVFIDNGINVLVSKEKNIMESVENLAKLLEQLSNEGKNPAKIDLRYDKVVVSY